MSKIHIKSEQTHQEKVLPSKIHKIIHIKESHLTSRSLTCSLFMEAINGRITGFSLAGNSDIQTTAEAIKAETLTCKLLWKISKFTREDQQNWITVTRENDKNKRCASKKNCQKVDDIEPP